MTTVVHNLKDTIYAGFCKACDTCKFRTYESGQRGCFKNRAAYAKWLARFKMDDDPNYCDKQIKANGGKLH